MRAALASEPVHSALPVDHFDVFVGYRGADADAARRLHDELAAGVHHDGRPQRVRWFEPGRLVRSTVVMPQLLRWTVLGTITTMLGSSREMWVVDSERHEALLNRVEVGDLRRRVVAATW